MEGKKLILQGIHGGENPFSRNQCQDSENQNPQRSHNQKHDTEETKETEDFGGHGEKIRRKPQRTH